MQVTATNNTVFAPTDTKSLEVSTTSTGGSLEEIMARLAKHAEESKGTHQKVSKQQSEISYSKNLASVRDQRKAAKKSFWSGIASGIIEGVGAIVSACTSSEIPMQIAQTFSNISKTIFNDKKSKYETRAQENSTVGQKMKADSDASAKTSSELNKSADVLKDQIRQLNKAKNEAKSAALR